MFRRKISEEDVRQVLVTGKTIEIYLQDQPYPSRLILGWQELRPIHVVAADNQTNQETIIITVYEPDPGRWEPDFETRRKPWIV
jgi:hypothetical protein